MAKKNKPLRLYMGGATEDVCAELENCGIKGYYHDTILLSFQEGVYTTFRIEAIEVSKQTPLPGLPWLTAVNPTYQERLSQYGARNNHSNPLLMTYRKKEFYIQIEPMSKRYE
jgi:hypothetical protein